MLLQLKRLHGVLFGPLLSMAAQACSHTRSGFNGPPSLKAAHDHTLFLPLQDIQKAIKEERQKRSDLLKVENEASSRLQELRQSTASCRYVAIVLCCLARDICTKQIPWFLGRCLPQQRAPCTLTQQQHLPARVRK